MLNQYLSCSKCLFVCLSGFCICLIIQPCTILSFCLAFDMDSCIRYEMEMQMIDGFSDDRIYESVPEQ